MSEEQLKTIEQMAYLGFEPKLIAINIDISEIDMELALRESGNTVRKAYYKGLIRLQMELRTNLIQSAKNGSNPAIEQLTKILQQLQSCL